jgi:viroplasmin and RNaseH domain-containing protein
MIDPIFPCFDLTFWDSLDIDNCLEIDAVLLGDEQFYSTSEKFKKYLLNHIVVDSNGKKYRAVNLISYSSWRQIIPFIAKAKVRYESLESNLSLDELRKVLLNKLDESNNQEELVEWRTKIIKAKDYQELFGF